MNKLVLSLVAVFAAFSVSAQCTELFISEYVEGSRNNKALEIYNPSDQPIKLSDYSINRYSNGSSSAQSLALGSRSLLPGETFVIVIDKQDPNASGYDTIVYDELRAKADTFMSGAYPGPMFYNGNDAVTLEKNGVLVDIIGVKGQDPGNAWTCDAAAGYTDLLGGRWMTKNKTLVRKPEVDQGTSTWPVAGQFNLCLEWDSLPNNTFDSLGFHTCNCQSSDIIIAEKEHNAYFFPNPVTQESFTIVASDVITSVSLINMVGQEVIAIENREKDGKMQVKLEDLTTGIYMVRILFADNKSLTKKIIIK